MQITRAEVIISFIWKFLEKVSVQGIQFLVTIILARMLLPSDFGLIALIVVFVNLANVIIDGGLNSALIQKKNSDNIDFSTILYFSIAMSLLIYCCLFFLSPLIANFFGQSELTTILRVLSISIIIFSFNSVQRAYVSKHMLFKKLFLSSFIAVLISGVIGIYTAYLGFGVWSLVFYQLSSSLITTISMWITIKWVPSLAFSVDRLRVLFSFGWKMMATSFIIQLFLNVRSLLIGKLYTPSALAYFDRGRQFPNLVMDNINVSIQTVLFPVFSEFQNDRDKIKSMVSRAIKLNCFIIFPLMFGLVACAKPLVLLLLTEKWAMAIPYVQIFSLSFVLMPMQLANLEAIKSLGHSDIILKLELLKKILEVIILIISCLISPLAIAWGVLLYNFICVFINLYPNNHLLNYSIYEQLIDVLPVFLISSIMCLCLLLMSKFLIIGNFILLFIQIVFGVCFYYFVCRLFKIDSLVYIKNILLNRRNLI